MCEVIGCFQPCNPAGVALLLLSLVSIITVAIAAWDEEIERRREGRAAEEGCQRAVSAEKCYFRHGAPCAPKVTLREDVQ